MSQILYILLIIFWHFFQCRFKAWVVIGQRQEEVRCWKNEWVSEWLTICHAYRWLVPVIHWLDNLFVSPRIQDHIWCPLVWLDDRDILDKLSSMRLWDRIDWWLAIFITKWTLPAFRPSRFFAWPQRLSSISRRSPARRSCSRLTASAAFLRNNV